MKNLCFFILFFVSTCFVCCITKDFTGNIIQVCPHFSQNLQNSTTPTTTKRYLCKQNFNVVDTFQNATVCGTESSIANRVVNTLKKTSFNCIMLNMELVNVSSGVKNYFSTKSMMMQGAMKSLFENGDFHYLEYFSKKKKESEKQ